MPGCLVHSLQLALAMLALTAFAQQDTTKTAKTKTTKSGHTRKTSGRDTTKTTSAATVRTLEDRNATEAAEDGKSKGGDGSSNDTHRLPPTTLFTYTLPDLTPSAPAGPGRFLWAVACILAASALFLQVQTWRKLTSAPKWPELRELDTLRRDIDRLSMSAPLPPRESPREVYSPRPDERFQPQRTPQSFRSQARVIGDRRPPGQESFPQPEPQPQPQMAYDPAPDPPDWDQFQTIPAEAAVTVEPSPFAGVVSDYHRVRRASPGDADRERKRFEARYRITRVSCVNLDERRGNPSATLHFEEDAWGTFILIQHEGQALGFPSFGDDLAAEREQHKEVFDYPSSGGTAFQVTKPALLEKDASQRWILKASGRLEADV